METLWHVALIFAVALAATLVMVPVSKVIAKKIGAIDYPSNRRINTEPIPRCGGIAMYVGFLVGMGVFWMGVHTFGWRIVDFYTLERINYPLLLLGVTAMFGLGLVDDAFQLKAAPKFLGQIVACVIVVCAGVSLDVIASASGEVNLGWLDFPLSVFYLLVFVNVINLIDGLDGLAAGIVAISTLAFMVLVIDRGSFTLTIVCLCLFAACLGFLRFNFSPASVFMGDSGALFLGLMVGIISLLGVVRTQSVVVMMIPITIAAVPIIDTSAAIVRRKLAHKSLGEADTDHIHHRLLRSGLSQRRTVLFLYACTIISSAIAIGVTKLPEDIRGFAVVALIVIGVAIICALGIAGPVLQHHYEGKGRSGPRRPREKTASLFEKKLK